MSKTKSKSAAPIKRRQSIGIMGAKLYFDERAGINFKPYLNMAKAPVSARAIYAQTLEELLTQLSVLSQMVGAADLLMVATQIDVPTAKSRADQQTLDNLVKTMETIQTVILQKFSAIPR